MGVLKGLMVAIGIEVCFLAGAGILYLIFR